MDRITDILNEYYNKKILKYGDTVKALGYENRYTQEVRFNILSRILTKKGTSLLDVGCGFGDLFLFLQKMEWNGDYTGIDISEQMLTMAREKLKFLPVSFFKHDISKPVNFGKYDYVLLSGTMNNKISNNTGQYVWAKKIIKNMWETCNIAVAFNMLSTWRCESKNGDIFAYDPQKILKFCQTLTNCIIFDHSYLPHDFTIFMIQERGELNWKLYHIITFLKSLIGKKF